jgi:UDPglucose 6-dehydrogenase
MPPHSPNNHECRSRWPAGRRTRIGVIGAGELGLRTALEFAERGHQVVCADDSELLEAAAGRSERARRNIGAGRLRFTSSSADVARHGEVIFMAFAPSEGERDEAQTARLFDAAVELAQNLTGPAVIIDKSTASSAIADRVADLMARNSDHEIVVVSDPQPSRRALRVFFRSNDVTPNDLLA